MTSRAPVLLLSTVAFLSAVLDAQTGRRAFNVNAQTVGANFQGDDIVFITSKVKVSSALKPKSEFETSQEYARRLEHANSNQLMPGISGQTLLAFSLEETEILGEIKADYDADARALSITLDTEPMTFTSDPGRPELDTLRVRAVFRSGRVYTAQNVFGATQKVTERVIDVYGLAFEQDSSLFPKYPHVSEFDTSISLGPEQARSLKSSLGLILICKLAQPWYRESISGHEATFDNPNETLEVLKFLQVVPQELWVINKRTGEVVLKSR